MFDAPRLKPRLAAGTPIGLAWCMLGSPALVELAASAGAEAVVIDLQHGLFDRAGLEASVRAADRAACIVRTEDGSEPAIARALDAGAEGVLVPMVETGAQAAAAAAAAHYAPKGRRSAGGVRPLADFARYRAWAAEAVTVGVMIETAAGVEAAEAIAGAPLVDFVFIGSGDLGLSLGGDAAALEAACRTIRAACRAAARPCGIFTGSRAEAERRAQEGYALVTTAADIVIAAAGFADAARPLA
jgi:2-dehydro-3-deoxyglucarate aldolase/4-hydroxy-2-oxoheptanedioate aldolase